MKIDGYMNVRNCINRCNKMQVKCSCKYVVCVEVIGKSGGGTQKDLNKTAMAKKPVIKLLLRRYAGYY